MPNIVLEALACGTQVISTPEAGGVIDLASELPAEALTLVSSKAEMFAAMNAVKSDGQSSLRPSLLPARFEEGSVATAFAEVFATL
jgi:hypothetical protein